MQEQLKTALSQAIGEFNNRRAEILEQAFNEGGRPAVTRLVEEYDALRDAYFEILRRELDANNHLYEKVLTAANNEVEKLEESISQLNNINEIINLITSVINLVGRALIVLGV